MSEIYRYSNFNWVIETQYDQLKDLQKFLNEVKGVSYKKGLSTSGNANQDWYIGKGADYSKNKSFVKISKSISKILSEQLIKYDLLEKDIFLKPVNSWSVTGVKGSHHTVHDHGNNIGICSIIYTQVPEVINDEDFEGHVYFIMSSEIRSEFYKSAPKVVTLKPELGKMIIFPSHLLHGVYTYPEGVRQSFNLDFLLTPIHQVQNYKYQYD